MITLDSKSTRDIDDAFDVNYDNDIWTLTVAIADVAKFVSKGSPFDEKAYEMTATRYYATGNSPMLPRRFSEDQLSLWPRKPKNTLIVRLSFNKELELTNTIVEPRIIKSRAKLSYEEVPEILKDKDRRHYILFQRARSLAFGLLQKRRDAGAMALYDLNNGWVTTEEGALKKLEKHEDTIGYIIIQEFMIAANAAVSEWCINREIPILFRNHRAHPSAPGREVILEQIQEGFEVPQQDLDLVRHRVHMLMQKAEYGATVSGHYSLNLAAYTHFTSPIRRYVDLINHRQIRAFLDGCDFPYMPDELQTIAEHVNEVTLREKEATAEYLKNKADSRAARVVEDPRRLDGLSARDYERAFKVQIRSEEPPSEGFVKIFQKRLQEGRMPLICYTALLAEASEEWKDLKQETLNHLTPAEGFAVYQQGIQGYEWEEPVFESNDMGPPHAKVFSSMASTSKVKGTLDVAATAKEAKHRACINLMAAMFGLDVPDYPEPEVKPQKPKAKKPDWMNLDSVSILQQHCVANGKQPPSYEYTMEGPSHAPKVTCRCIVQGVTKEAEGPSKKEAKKKAAALHVNVLIAKQLSSQTSSAE